MRLTFDRFSTVFLDCVVHDLGLFRPFLDRISTVFLPFNFPPDLGLYFGAQRRAADGGGWAISRTTQEGLRRWRSTSLWIYIISLRT